MNSRFRWLCVAAGWMLLLGLHDADAVTVCASGCDFDKIRTAVNSGAALIEVRPGTYPSSEASVQLEGQALVGVGGDRSYVVIVGDCVFGGTGVIRVLANPKRSEIRGVTIMQPVGCSFDNGVLVGGDVSIDNAEISGFPRTGTNGGGIVVSNNAAEVLVTQVRLSDNGIGLNAGSKLGVFFSDFSGNRDRGISLFGDIFAHDKSILGSRLSDNGNHGLYTVVPVSVEDTEAIGNGITGLFHDDGSQPTLFNSVGVRCEDDRDPIIDGTVITENSSQQTVGCVSCAAGQTQSCDSGFVGLGGIQTCSGDGFWGLCSADPVCADRETPSTCTDGIDNDCDFVVDSADVDCALSTPMTHGDVPASGKIGDPVDTFTGELYRHLAPDIDLGGPLRLHFSRYYASALQPLGRSGQLGTNWRHNFEWWIDDAGTTVTVIDPMGRSIGFDQDGAEWQLQNGIDVPYQLIEPTAGAFVLGDPRDGYSYHFANGRLERINHGTSVSLLLSYSGANLDSVADGLGRQLSFSYTGSLLAGVSDGMRSVAFDHAGDLLATVIDVRGQQTTYSYDGASGRLLTWTRPEGNEPFVQTYDVNGRVATQTSGSGQTWTLGYAANSTSITDPLGRTMTQSHSPRGELAHVVDESGDDFQIGYARHQRDALSDRRGGTTLVERHAPTGRPAHIVGADGAQTDLYYGPHARDGLQFWKLHKTRFPDGEEESYEWAARAPSALVDRAGHRWTATFNSLGLPTASANPKGGTSASTYHADGTVASHTDTAGNTTTFIQDALRRPMALEHADGSTRSYVWNEANQLLMASDERGHGNSWTYDSNGNPATHSDALMNATVFAFDDDDRLAVITDPLGHATTLGYDALGRLSSLQDGSGRTWALGHDPRGRLNALVVPGGATWQRSVDGEGVVTSLSDPLGHVVTFGADAMGRITTRSSPLGHVATTRYDPVGRVLDITAADGHVTEYDYDPRGLRTGTDYQGATMGFALDELGLPVGIVDSAGHSWPAGRDAMGRLTSIGDPLGQVSTLGYDNRNRVSSATFPGGLGTLDLGYDATGNITSRDYSDGTSISMDWDARNLPISGTGLALSFDAAGRVSSSNGLAITRDPAGRLLSIDYDTGGGTKLVSYAYDARGVLATVTDWLGGVTSFGFDAAGRMISITRPNGVDSTYTWDDDNRLVGLQHGSLVDIALTLDAAGRTLSASRTVPLDATALPSPGTFNHDAASQIDSSGYVYDALGRQTAGNGRTLEWDLASRLTGVTGSETVSYQYDALGLRIGRAQAGATREYVWNYALPLPMVAIERESGSDVRYDIPGPGGMLLYSLDATSGARRDYHFDELGHTLMLTDASGDVASSYAYGPYGELLATAGESGNPYTWLGQWSVMQDATTGMYYARARWYSAEDRRFVSRDVRPAHHPLASSPYQYAFGNPLRWVDADGHSPETRLERLLGGRPVSSAHVQRLEDLLGELESARVDVTPEFESIVGALFMPNNYDGAVERVNRVDVRFHNELRALDLTFGWSKTTGVSGGVAAIDRAIVTVRETLQFANQKLDEAIATAPAEWESGGFRIDVPAPLGESPSTFDMPQVWDLEWELKLSGVKPPPPDASFQVETELGFFLIKSYVDAPIYGLSVTETVSEHRYNLPPVEAVAPYMLQESVREKLGLMPHTSAGE